MLDWKHPPSRFEGDTEIAWTSETNSQSTTQALYLIDTLKFNEQWQAYFSMRRDWWEAENGTIKSRTNTGGNLSAWTKDVAASNRRIKERLFSYRGAVTFKPVPEGSLYAAYGNAKQPSSIGTARAGGVGALDDVTSPSKVKTYEVGSKWDMWDEALSLSAALFRTELNAPVNAGTNANPDMVRLEQRVDGLELSAAGKLLPNWTVFGGYSYMKSKITEDQRTGTTANE